MSRHARPARGVLVALLALVALRLVHWLLSPPNSDEAYYWAWGFHPALSYYDHPPLLAWIQGALRATLGRSLLVLRLPSALATAGTLAVLAWIARRLGGPERGTGAAVAAALLGSPLLLLFTSLAWHDALLVFFVALSGALLVDFLAEVAAGGRGRTSRLLLAAAALGVAGLSKYSAAFVGLGFAGAIASDRRLRPLLLDPRLYAAAAITLAVVSPVLVWNLQHGLASFRFHLLERQRLAQGIHLKPAAVVAFVVPTLLLAPTLAAAAVLALREGSPPDRFAEVYRRVALAVLVASTAFFAGLSLFSWSFYYWNLAAYVLLVPPAALALAARPRLMRAHLAYGVAAAALLVAHAVVIPLSAPFPFIDDEDSKEPHGWEGIARAVKAELERTPGAFPATTDYRSASHLAWALGMADVTSLSEHRSEFDYWADPRRVGATAVLVTDRRAPLTAGVAGRFDRVRHLASLPVERLGFRLKTYELWAAEGYHAPAPAPAR
jgi:4-amino-4-deoxy-L-arabinose transferase-like glycosyltransferase